MVNVLDIERYCNRELQVTQFDDYAPNGLQVDGGKEVTRLVSGVTASQALIDAAIEVKADAILVHHGYFWKGESPTLTGIKGRRIRTLMQHGISLLAYHLPLDAHLEFGNNRLLGDLLGIVDQQPPPPGTGLVWQGVLPAPMSGAEFSTLINERLSREPLHLSGGDGQIQKVAWCSGGAQGYLSRAAELGVDAYISGEVSEQTTHLARELNVHYFAAGHHATERLGVSELASRVAKVFHMAHFPIEIPNSV
ncbi:MAG: Nif3-like dinuclear metal center hexameric protein [Candidatus Polarisedimenticolaceae bacterium]|nr:Nif3-like dinuclear metal center hexameric protein [Candidatus Polarisedimenticolaceae bacterium]